MEELHDLPKLEANFKYTPHILLFTIIFLFQYFTKTKEINSNLDPVQKKAGEKLLWRYMLVVQIAKAADWCLGPFIYEFFEGYHRLNIENIGKMLAVSFISNLFLGPLLIGYLNDKSDRKFPCLIYGILISFSCFIRQIRSPIALVISQILIGMSTSVLYSSFENWFVCETTDKIKDQEVKDFVLSSAFEKSMVGDSIVAVSTNFVAGVLKTNYGIRAPYFFSMFLGIISFISVIFLVNSAEEDNNQPPKENKHDMIDVFKNIKESFYECYKTPFIILIGLTESLLFSILHLFIFSWTPALREFNEPFDSSEVFTLFMISLMVGGTCFRVIYLFFDNDSFKVAKIISAICVISFFFTNLWISYRVTTYAFIMYEVSVGMLYPTYSKIRSEYLPQNNRGTLMNIFKIPLNLVVIFTLFTMNSLFTLKQLFFIKLVIAILVLFLQFIFFYKKPEIKMHKVGEPVNIPNDGNIGNTDNVDPDKLRGKKRN